MTLRGLIEAVERGDYHRDGGSPHFTKMWDAAVKLRMRMADYCEVCVAMADGPAATAAILRALESDARAQGGGDA